MRELNFSEIAAVSGGESSLSIWQLNAASGGGLYGYSAKAVQGSIGNNGPSGQGAGVHDGGYSDHSTADNGTDHGF